MVPTRVHERYLFPFFALGAILAAISFRWRLAYVVLALANFANLYAVLTTLLPNNPGISDWLGSADAPRSPAGVDDRRPWSTGRGVRVGADQLRSRRAAPPRGELAEAAAASSQADRAGDELVEDDTGSARTGRDAARGDRRAGRARRPATAVEAAAGPDASVGAGRRGAGRGSAGHRGGRSPRPPPRPPRSPRWTRATRLRSARGHRLVPAPPDRGAAPARPQRPAARRERRPARQARPADHRRPARRVLTLRIFRLSDPYEFHFDEVYHARTAMEFLQGWRYGISHDIYEWTHPHLAKYAMADGIVLLRRQQGHRHERPRRAGRSAVLVEPRWDDEPARRPGRRPVLRRRAATRSGSTTSPPVT